MVAIVKCAECGSEVSTTAAACPSCGAPFKSFMGKPKSFKDRFSEVRLDAAKRDARADFDKQKKSMAGCLWTAIGFILLLFLVGIIL